MKTTTERSPLSPPGIATRLGPLSLLGETRWGHRFVACPNCGGKAAVDERGDLWCWVCNYTSAGASGCT